MEVVIANKSHIHYAKQISELISSSAQVRGTGIARRTPSSFGGIARGRLACVN